MKGGLVSMLYGAAAARELGLLGDGRIVLHLVCDEETGSAAGSGHLRAAGMIDPDALAMVTAEPTGGVVWHASRGAITLRVERARPRGPRRPGAPRRQRLRAHGRASPSRSARSARELLASAGSMLDRGRRPTGSGANFNVVPGAAWFSVDRRFNPEERARRGARAA